MKEYTLSIVGHSADLKTLPTGSKDTGIFFPQDLIDFLGSDENYSFKIYKDDCAKAMAAIISALPLYSNKGGNKITHSRIYDEANRLMSMITGFFGNDDFAIYSGFYLSQTTGGRRYLYGLEQKGFSIRKFLVADHSILKFQIDDKESVTLRFQTKINPNQNELEDEFVSDAHKEDHKVTKDIAYSPYLTAIRTKPFLLLAGISGTGKSRIVRKLAQATNDIDFEADYNGDERWKMHNPTNFCLIQVKPNWHNSMDVVGFKSNIGGAHYEFTPFIEFIAKAWHYPDTPFFLCLDEMNLAPVEEYFAEFLSAIESRSYNKDGEYDTDPIVNPFDSFGLDVSGQMIRQLVISELDTDCKLENQFRTKGLTLPKNLIVMGTVNMDETTFSFSRKVLDRAMSIEMNEVNYDAFLSGQTEEDVPLLTDCNGLLVERPINAQTVKADIEADKIIEYLKNVNALLEGTPFKLGYRAANEAFLYVSASKMFGSNDLGSALDNFTVMKILSRIEGDDSKLKTKAGEELLPALLELLNNQFGGDSNSISIQKLTEMNDILVRDHFVSFWG